MAATCQPQRALNVCQLKQLKTILLFFFHQHAEPTHSHLSQLRHPNACPDLNSWKNKNVPAQRNASRPAIYK